MSKTRGWRKQITTLTAVVSVSALGMGVVAAPALAETPSLAAGELQPTSMGGGSSLASERDLQPSVTTGAPDESPAAESNPPVPGVEESNENQPDGEKPDGTEPAEQLEVDDQGPDGDVEDEAAATDVDLSGQVFIGGVAASGATVTLTDTAGTSAVVVADAIGAFRFVSTEAVALLAGDIQVRVAEEGTLPVSVSVTVIAGEPYAMAPIRAEVAMDGVSGSVRAEWTNTPIAGATVTVADGKGRVVKTKTGKDGSWTVLSTKAAPLGEGVLAIYVVAPGYQSRSLTTVTGINADPVAIQLRPLTTAGLAIDNTGQLLWF